MAISPTLAKIVKTMTKRYMEGVVFDPGYNLVARGRNVENLTELGKLISDAFASGLIHGYTITESQS